MKQTWILLILFFLASCTNIQPTESPVIVVTKAIPTVTSRPPTAVPSFTPTVEPVCDLLAADFCITDGHFLLQRPIHPPANDHVDPFYRYASTANGTRDPHHGVEFSNPSGTPVYAAAVGTVLFAGFDEEAIYAPWQGFYGNLVVVGHDSNLFTLYAHLSSVDVQAGQKVSAGEKLGEVGMTGVAIGSHLHFEVRHGDAENYFATQNPELWLAPATDESGTPFGVLVISVIDEQGKLIKNTEFTIQYYQDRVGSPVKSYYGTTYSSDVQHGNENAALGELPAGQYRIAVEWNGAVYERWIEVESGKLTQVIMVLK